MISAFQAGIIALFAKRVRSIGVSAVPMLSAKAASRKLHLPNMVVAKGSAMTALSLHYSERKEWILTQTGYGVVSTLVLYEMI